ncbi:hypothetical protein F4779DRAFT_616112 [Xylariaceae sp. FL0662B]|nr:hypothetical protein F4779DRAFT_616112 [Xylariaceae sp. FL0662B]
MPPNDMLTDDYVAELLAKEANDCSLKYSAMGLDAYKSTKRPSNQPKPNTRFLNNIIRDTNSHNRALLAKESAESKARLRDLEKAEQIKRREEERRLQRLKPGPGDTRKRMLGDIASILGGSSKRRRTERSSKATSNTTDSAKPGPEESTERRRNIRGTDDDTVDTRKHKNRKELYAEPDSIRRHIHHREHDDHASRSPSPDRQDRTHRQRSSRARGDLFDGRRKSSSDKRLERESSPPKDTSDSDPLDDIIGPAPPPRSTVRRRGRGANSAASGIDSRFAPDYDPKRDITPEPDDGNDWDNAVEVFRDRQKLKQQQADRLRSAGFTEDDIRKWEKGTNKRGNGDDKDETDVQWNKRGGLREWDRGKVLDDDGNVCVETKQGRLKDA